MHRLEKKHLIYITLIFIASVVPNFFKLYNACFNTWDFGIFIEAVQKIEFATLNPMIESYGFRIFNDHFDPILLLPAFLAKVIPAGLSLLIVEVGFTLLATVPIFLLVRKSLLQPSAGIFLIVFILFNRATLSALYYPVHPTTWAMAPLSFLLYAIFTRNRLIALMSLMILFCCKEEFPFIGLFLSVYLFLSLARTRENIFYTSACLFISIVWLWFVFIFRPRFFNGAFLDHGGGFLGTLFSNPTVFLEKYDFSTLKYIFFTFFPLILAIHFSKIKIKNLWWTGIFICFPMIALRVISGKFGHQYTAPMMIPFLFLLVDQRFFLEKKHLAALLAILFLITGIPILKEYRKLIDESKDAGCSASSERYENVLDIQKFDFGMCREVYATGGASFALVQTQTYPRILPPFSQKITLGEDSCLVLDQKYGDVYPRSREEVEEYKSFFPEIFSNKSFTILSTTATKK